MAKKSKANRVIVTLECTEQRAANVGGISRYHTQKNRKNTPGRMELKKFNRYMNKYTLHRETK